jgi:hypothetical protein
VASLAAGLIALVAVAAATAAGPAFHDHGTFTDVDPNFCGTGESVDVAGRFNFKGWLGETGGDPEQEVRSTFNYAITLTNPDNEASVVDSAAGSITNEIVTGLESGPHTHLFVENGLRAKLKLSKGRVLTHDAGSLGYTVSFDADDNVVGLDVLFVRGPHPAFESDVWCDAAIEALGL